MTAKNCKEKGMNMKGRLAGAWVAVLVFLAAGCGLSPNMNTIYSQGEPRVFAGDLIHLKQYQVTGQVFDLTGRPVKGCQVFLIKRHISKVGSAEVKKEAIRLIKNSPVALTDSEGQYFMTFEPGEANDIWLAFSDGQSRFEDRSVRLNEKLGNTLLEYPGNNPVYLSVVLEYK